MYFSRHSFSDFSRNFSKISFGDFRINLFRDSSRDCQRRNEFIRDSSSKFFLCFLKFRQKLLHECNQKFLQKSDLFWKFFRYSSSIFFFKKFFLNFFIYFIWNFLRDFYKSSMIPPIIRWANSSIYVNHDSATTQNQSEVSPVVYSKIPWNISSGKPTEIPSEIVFLKLLEKISLAMF